ACRDARAPSPGTLPVIRPDGHELRVTFPLDEQQHRTIRRPADGGAELIDRLDRLTIHFLNDVAFAQPGVRGTALRIHVRDDKTIGPALDGDTQGRLVHARGFPVARQSPARFRFVQLDGDRLLDTIANDHDAGVRPGLRFSHVVAEAVD